VRLRGNSKESPGKSAQHEPRALLSTFTKGFDARDPKEAKALLGQLAV
jgi:hypothetical protein